MDFTGERFVPGTPGEIWYEHWHRYHFAVALVAGRRVLDVACGEGYGSALLAGSALSVTGVDLAPAAIAHARGSYARPNLEFIEADCTRLPFDDASFDVVVSFETIEHITAQEAFLDEVKRVLAPEGLVVLSSPNRPEYSHARGIVNPFHVRELDRTELANLVAPRFAHHAWYGQHVSFFSVIAAEDSARGGELFVLSQDRPANASPGHARPRYFLMLASAAQSRIEECAPRISILADRDEAVYRDYEKVTASLHDAHERGNALERQVAQLHGHHDQAVLQRDLLQTAHAEAVRQRDALELEIATLRGVVESRDATVAAAHAWQAKLEADITALQAELARGASWRGLARLLMRLVGAPRRDTTKT